MYKWRRHFSVSKESRTFTITKPYLDIFQRSTENPILNARLFMLRSSATTLARFRQIPLWVDASSSCMRRQPDVKVENNIKKVNLFIKMYMKHTAASPPPLPSYIFLAVSKHPRSAEQRVLKYMHTHMIMIMSAPASFIVSGCGERYEKNTCWSTGCFLMRPRTNGPEKDRLHSRHYRQLGACGACACSIFRREYVNKCVFIYVRRVIHA